MAIRLDGPPGARTAHAADLDSGLFRDSLKPGGANGVTTELLRAYSELCPAIAADPERTLRAVTR